MLAKAVNGAGAPSNSKDNENGLDQPRYYRSLCRHGNHQLLFCRNLTLTF